MVRVLMDKVRQYARTDGYCKQRDGSPRKNQKDLLETIHTVIEMKSDFLVGLLVDEMDEEGISEFNKNVQT